MFPRYFHFYISIWLKKIVLLVFFLSFIRRLNTQALANIYIWSVMFHWKHCIHESNIYSRGLTLTFERLCKLIYTTGGGRIGFLTYNFSSVTWMKNRIQRLILNLHCHKYVMHGCEAVFSCRKVEQRPEPVYVEKTKRVFLLWNVIDNRINTKKQANQLTNIVLLIPKN